MYGPKYQWIISHGLPETWYEDVHYLEPHNCTRSQYLEFADGYLTVSRSSLRRDGVRTIASMVYLLYLLYPANILITIVTDLVIVNFLSNYI